MSVNAGETFADSTVSVLRVACEVFRLVDVVVSVNSSRFVLFR